MAPGLFNNMILQVLLNTLVSMNQVLLVVAGLYLIHLVTRTIHVGLSGVLAVSTYTVYWALQHDFHILLALSLGACMAVGLGFFSHLLLRPFVRDKQPLIALLASISMWTCLQSLVSIGFGSSGRFLTPSALATVQLGSVFLSRPALWSLEFGLVVLLISSFLLYATPLGRILRAIEQHEASASSLGIREHRIQIFAFVSASLLMFFVGIFSGLNSAISPTMGNELLFSGFIALLVGGSQSFVGVILASALLSLIPGLLTGLSLGDWSVGDSWQPVITFVVAALMLYVKPNGILNSSIRKV